MHWFLDPIKHHYADFSGRASRKEYWMFVLYYVLISIALSIVEVVVGIEDVLTGLLALGLLIPSVAIAARRLHDIGKSGWWQLIGLIPIIGWIIIIVMLARKSDPTPNEYGAMPGGGVGTTVDAVVDTAQEAVHDVAEKVDDVMPDNR